MDFPSNERSREFVIQTILKSNELSLRQWVKSKVPQKIRNKYWRTGFRIEKMSNMMFKEGLVSAVQKDKTICYQLVECFLESAAMSPIQIAFLWWPFDSSGMISEECYRWISVRFQPVAEQLIWYQIDFLGKKNLFEGKTIVETKNNYRVLCASSPLNIESELLIDYILKNLHETALEFTIPIVKLESNILLKIHDKNFLSAASDLIKSKNYRHRILASTCLFFANEFDSIDNIINEAKFEHPELRIVQRSAFEALIALKKLDYDKSLSIVNEIKFHYKKWFEWPTWSVIEGLSYYKTNQFTKASLAFLNNGGGSRGGSLLPLQIANESLQVGGFESPKKLKNILLQPYASPDERLIIEKEIQSMYGCLPISIEKKRVKNISTSIINTNISGNTQGSIPEAFYDLEKLLRMQFETKKIVEQNLLDGDYDALTENSLILKKINFDKNKCFLSLLSDIDCLGATINAPSLIDVKFGTIELIDQFLRDLKDFLKHAISKFDEEMKKKKENLINRFTLAGIDIPDNLNDIKSIFQFGDIEKQYVEKLEFEEIYNECIQNVENLTQICKIPLINRVNFYQKLSRTKNNSHITYKLLKAFLLENDLLSEVNEKNTELLLELILGCLKNQQVLPSGIWRSLKESNGGKLAPILEGSEIFNEYVKCDLLNISELASLYDGDINSLPDNIMLGITISNIDNESTVVKIPKLCSLFLQYSNEPKIIKLLLAALKSVGRYEEALCVIYLGIRNNLLELEDQEISSILVLVLLIKPIDFIRSQKKAVIEILFTDFAWIVKRNCDIAALLYIMSVYNLADLYINFKFQYSDEIKFAKINYPGLIGYLIEVMDKKSTYDHTLVVDESLIHRGLSALSSFEHDLEKQSCYLSWDTATKYQKHFKKVLVQSLEKLRNSENLIYLDPDSIIKDAQKSENLSFPNNKVHLKMRQYLEKQFLRLKIITESCIEIEFENLDILKIEYLNNLQLQSKPSYDDIVVNIVYRNIMEENFD